MARGLTGNLDILVNKSLSQGLDEYFHMSDGGIIAEYADLLSLGVVLLMAGTCVHLKPT